MRPPPEGVALHTPEGDTIPCVLVYVGEVIDHGRSEHVWEAMPERDPVGFGQEPGWHVTVKTMPGDTTIRLCLPEDFDPSGMFIPPAIPDPPGDNPP